MTSNDIIRLLTSQLRTLTSNDNAYGWTKPPFTRENEQSISWEEIENHLAVPKLDLEEGYYTIVSVEQNTDCDHGPCVGMTLDNGWIVWTYRDKPDLISFHPNFIAEVDDHG